MFKVGDKVRIKSREQMEKEFGLDSNGYINCLNTFNATMKPLCGMTGIIYRATPYDIELIDRSYNIDISDWALSIDMIELVEPERTPTPGEYVQISSDGINRYTRIYLCTNSTSNHFCIYLEDEQNYHTGYGFNAIRYDLIRKMPQKQTYTIEATEEQYKKIQEILKN